MPYKGPHISISADPLVERVLGVPDDEFKAWPEHVREAALDLTAELFLIRYNPFIDPDTVWQSVQTSFAQTKLAMAEEYSSAIATGMFRFWNRFRDDQKFKDEVIKRLQQILPEESIDKRPNSRVECATDATDLRMELPLLVLLPETTAHIRDIVRLAREMNFSLIPRGGGSGLTGGAIPGDRRSIVLSMAKLDSILSVDTDEMVLCTQGGVITLDAINAAAKKNMLFTVDPASKAASSIGGNISENSGGPFAFEYGTTIDNILSYKMVTPDGDLIEVRRVDHPRHKIMPGETAIFEILDEEGKVKDVIKLGGNELRAKGLGKDVTDKFLGGLPGVQKEGVDGIITEGCFTLHPVQAHSRVLCLEFFGRTMRPAMQVIKDIVGLRDTIREQGDLVKISALEEFGIKYVQAIEYKKKSSRYEGEPISVLILQLDSQDQDALDQAVQAIVDIAEPYENVDVFAASNPAEAEYFWEDRHKLSAISKRTSGFKINEDVVIPIGVIPQFSDFLEAQNLYYMAVAYRAALQDVGRLQGFGVQDKFINMEFTYASRIINGEVTTAEISDEELGVQAYYFFRDLKSRYSDLSEKLDGIYENIGATRIIIANHMHAGDGNCHVNLPVNSNDPEMMRLAEEAVHKISARVGELGGVVSGEHGIGITKIGFLPEAKIKALAAYKQIVDPHNILNPGKLVKRELPVTPYTFSFNKLIGDLAKTGLADRKRLMSLLTNVQTCTRCGKCKYVCPMYSPTRSLIHHPRNKNISLGAIIEAIYYSLVVSGEPDESLMRQLRDLMDHCTACGKCMSVCPVKINTPEVTLHMRTFLEEKGAGGHPLKSHILHYLTGDPVKRVPRAAKFAAMGQAVGNRAVGLIPAPWRKRAQSPIFQGKGPALGFKNLSEVLHLDKGSLFAPAGKAGGTVFYFPGCGASLFTRTIGMAGLYLLLKSRTRVILPPEHMCCGYPLLASGCEEAFNTNRSRNMDRLSDLVHNAAQSGFTPHHVLTSCGTCREALSEYHLDTFTTPMAHMDVTQYILENTPGLNLTGKGPLLYHSACHAEWSGVPASKAGAAYAKALTKLTGQDVNLSPGCCGESGMGALTTPAIYNRLRAQKQMVLKEELPGYDEKSPVLVGCPSCRVGISRSLIALNEHRAVLHTLEYLAELAGGPKWKKELLTALKNGESTTDGRTVSLKED
ncbi:FAD-binding and (Fe-S)-binding domain-containing protein [Desulfovibrio ferrophilus]|uniref:FAD linked oxidase domain protein n=1 Tax=Desulfovibrio ferrophilus TaxID=241368 RepID=A0A2Z6AYQ3_9BACT|nr:FAD-binding and (Fe-S)-binding domain-containing protein [Desulfovibrio ferrophilus]BBD08391.1 FAD linked oxidase domain protein [Desulfovibrio ferrophilus]